MTRELEFQGEFSDSIARDFAFHKIEFQNDTYNGIAINLRYYLKVEMTYQSTLMKSQLVEIKDIIIRNKHSAYQPVLPGDACLLPSIRNSLYHSSQVSSMLLELNLKRNKINLD